MFARRSCWKVALAALVLALEHGVSASDLPSQPAPAIASMLHAKTDRLEVVPSSIHEVTVEAKPGSAWKDDEEYPKRYRRFLAEAAKGGYVVRWKHVGYPMSSGFAVVRDGVVTAELTLVIQ